MPTPVQNDTTRSTVVYRRVSSALLPSQMAEVQLSLKMPLDFVPRDYAAVQQFMASNPGKFRGCVLYTEFKGMFFGYVDGDHIQKVMDDECPVVHLYGARGIFYWDTSSGPEDVLATKGPTEACRISRPVPLMEVHKSTHIVFVEDHTLPAWEACPWGA